MSIIPRGIASQWSRQLLVVSKNSPRLLLGAGVVGMVGSTVLACRATLKLEEVLDIVENDLHTSSLVAMAAEDGKTDKTYTENDRKRDVTIIYVRAGVTVAKLYAPAVLLGAASISALTASHNLLSQRNMALTAAYAALDKGFTEYRERVIEKFGAEEDRKLRYDSEEVEIFDEKGKKQMVVRAAPGAASIYAKFFDQYSTSWNKEAEYNFLFLRSQQNYWNDLLNARGHVFLNEVYDSLGLEHSQAGAVVGWVLSNDGDNFIDFGIFDDTDTVRDFVNGRENSILLDFNVDGVIFDKIDDNRRGELAWQK